MWTSRGEHFVIFIQSILEYWNIRVSEIPGRYYSLIRYDIMIPHTTPPPDTIFNNKAAWDSTNTKYTLTLAASDVLHDMVFTCSVKIDGVWHTKTVDVDLFG